MPDCNSVMGGYHEYRIRKFQSVCMCLNENHVIFFKNDTFAPGYMIRKILRESVSQREEQ